MDINLADNFGFTPLITVCYTGSEESIKELLRKENLELNHRTKKHFGDVPSGSSALDLLKKKKLMNLVELIESRIQSENDKSKKMIDYQLLLLLINIVF